MSFPAIPALSPKLTALTAVLLLLVQGQPARAAWPGAKTWTAIKRRWQSFTETSRSLGQGRTRHFDDQKIMRDIRLRLRRTEASRHRKEQRVFEALERLPGYRPRRRWWPFAPTSVTGEKVVQVIQEVDLHPRTVKRVGEAILERLFESVGGRVSRRRSQEEVRSLVDTLALLNSELGHNAFGVAAQQTSALLSGDFTDKTSEAAARPAEHYDFYRVQPLLSFVRGCEATTQGPDIAALVPEFEGLVGAVATKQIHALLRRARSHLQQVHVGLDKIESGVTTSNNPGRQDELGSKCRIGRVRVGLDGVGRNRGGVTEGGRSVG